MANKPQLRPTGGAACSALATVFLLICGGAQADNATPSEVSALIVTAPSPMGGALDADAVPAASAALTARDLRLSGLPDALRGLDQRIAGVSMDAAQGNPWQPNLVYRGFEASPLAGDAQGLAVYVGGVRFNQPFGDTIDWDLLPDNAIERIDLVSSDPVYGLNALGGALAITLKNGFTEHENTLDLSGGSFGRFEGGMEWTRRVGDTALYAAVQGLREDGWRDYSPSSGAQVYADLGVRPGTGEFHLSLMGADTDLTGNGTTPVELLALDRAAVFTVPDLTRDRFARLAGTGEETFAHGLVLKFQSYLGRFEQDTLNGDAAQAGPCPTNTAVLCGQDGGVLTNSQGQAISNFVTGSPYIAWFPGYQSGGPYATLNTTSARTTSYGLALELSSRARIGSFSNQAVIGASFDGAVTDFSADTALGELSLIRGFIGPGVVIDQADGSIAPVSVRAVNDDLGLFLSDNIEVVHGLSLDLAGRYNLERVSLHDRLGVTLNGDHQFSRFDPAVGLVWRISQGLSVYAGYAEANRAPTPAELSCASPAAPCSLTNFFVGDPDLRQVVAHTVEGGFRGQFELSTVRADWHAGVYRETSDNDIQFVASAILGRDYFTNVGRTRRQGVETGINVEEGPVSGFVDFAYTDATYLDSLVLDGGGNPGADALGLIYVKPGDRIPAIPKSNLKFGARWRIGGGWQIGIDGRHAASQFLTGDAANLNSPVPGYWLLDLDVRDQVTRRLSIFVRIENLTNARYATFGDFSPTAQTPIIQDPEAQNPRSLSPGQPMAAFAGLSLSF